jgi:hypothetical protein
VGGGGVLAFFVATCFFAGGVGSLAYAYEAIRLAATIAAAAVLSLKFIGPLFFLSDLVESCLRTLLERTP